MLHGFRDFIIRGNVVSLAVAVVMGSAFSNLVNAMVKDLMTPFIAAIGGQPDFSKMYLTINKSRFMIGDFLNAIISFLIIAGVIYFFVVVPMNKIMERLKRGEKLTPAEKACVECLSLIPVEARRCRFCTTIVRKKAKKKK